MSDMTTAEAGSQFGDVIDRLLNGGERVLLTRHGKNVAGRAPSSSPRLIGSFQPRVDLVAPGPAW
ncbi:MAG: type II toxin-antitoxin system Phd/YefM family antitoxin [Dehalococcoidia bacterium]